MRHPIAVSPLESVGVAAARVRLGVAMRAEPRDIVCDYCERALCVAVRHSDHPVPLYLTESRLITLDETEDCRWCARPITAAGEAKVPFSGYLAVVRALVGDQTPGRTFNNSIDAVA